MKTVIDGSLAGSAEDSTLKTEGEWGSGKTEKEKWDMNHPIMDGT